jgi:hypothetical protein
VAGWTDPMLLEGDETAKVTTMKMWMEMLIWTLGLNVIKRETTAIFGAVTMTMIARTGTITVGSMKGTDATTWNTLATIAYETWKCQEGTMMTTIIFPRIAIMVKMDMAKVTEVMTTRMTTMEVRMEVKLRITIDHEPLPCHSHHHDIATYDKRELTAHIY